MRPQLHILIVGFGDIGTRVARLLAARAADFHITALIRRPEHAETARALGVVPVLGDLAQPETLRRLAGNYACVFHFAPPPAEGALDIHTRHLLAALSRHAARARMLSQAPIRRLVYISTTGVYGDCGGEWIDETRPPRPHNARATRRADAETTLRNWGRRTATQVSILRAPGIYAADRLPIERLQRGTPALLPHDDVFTNHIHAEDLARAALAAMFLGKPGRVINAVDDSSLLMGEYFDAVADRFGLPRAPRISREDAAGRISPALLSFMSESRRIRNDRVKRELRLNLRYPTVADFLATLPPDQGREKFAPDN
ncbi:MAG: SDR family oxidoreductase [Betaproteobacteria bacterium]|nr:SDR family oxidoreductase [Betaproteobacteria bacterium]